MAKSIVTPIGVISYPAVFRPKVIEAGKPPKYSCVLILEASKIQPIRDAILEVAQAEFGQDALEMLRTQRLSQPLRSGDEPKTADDPNYKGKWFFNAYSDPDKGAPSVLKYIGPGQSVPLTDQAELYAGCLVRLNVGFFAYKTQMKKGVGCGLNGVELIAPGTRIDGRKPADQAFAGAVDPEAEALRAAAQKQAEQGGGSAGGAPPPGAGGSPW